VATLLEPILGWDAAEKKASVTEFIKHLKNERTALSSLLEKVG
jgi:glycerol-3-phosphate dehydrogenase